MDKPKLTKIADSFLDFFANALAENDLTHFSDAIGNLKRDTIQQGPLPTCQHSCMSHLQRLSVDLFDSPILDAVHNFNWSQVYDGGGIESGLANGMLAAQAAGTYGIFPSQNTAAGLFALAPNVHYPHHTHAAREVYFCLAGDVDITHGLDKPAFNLRSNQLSETPSGRLHSLQTRESPVLLGYVWTGEISARTWWWEQDTNGDWIRTAWRRQPGESWTVMSSEQVNQQEFELAMR